MYLPAVHVPEPLHDPHSTSSCGVIPGSECKSVVSIRQNWDICISAVHVPEPLHDPHSTGCGGSECKSVGHFVCTYSGTSHIQPPLIQPL